MRVKEHSQYIHMSDLRKAVFLGQYKVDNAWENALSLPIPKKFPKKAHVSPLRLQNDYILPWRYSGLNLRAEEQEIDEELNGEKWLKVACTRSSMPWRPFPMRALPWVFSPRTAFSWPLKRKQRQSSWRAFPGKRFIKSTSELLLLCLERALLVGVQVCLTSTESRGICCAVAGITSDANNLIDYARLDAQKHLFRFNEPMPVEHLVQNLCNMKQGYTQYGGMAWHFTGFFLQTIHGFM